MEWPRPVNWDTPAGGVIQKVIAHLPPDTSPHLLVFGSAALQLTVAKDLLSADVDLAVEHVSLALNDSHKPFQREDLERIVEREHLGKGRAPLYVQVCYPQAFDTSPLWGRRAMSVPMAGAHLTVPHPYDILIGKLHRLEDKDLEAFEMVIAATGHPTAEEFRQELIQCPRLFQVPLEPNIPAQHNKSLLRLNVPKLWPRIFGKTISVDRDILKPAHDALTHDYGTGIGFVLKATLEEMPSSLYAPTDNNSGGA